MWRQALLKHFSPQAFADLSTFSCAVDPCTVAEKTALGGVLAKLVRTLTKLDDTLIRLKEDVDKLRDGNHESHKRIYEKLDLCEERIGELERR